MEKVEVVLKNFTETKSFKGLLAFIFVLGGIMFIRSEAMGTLFTTENYILLFTKNFDFSTILQSDVYPFAQVIAYFESYIFKQNIQAYRAFHLLIHLLCTLTLSLTLKKLNFRYFFMVGIIFFIHPVHLYSLTIFEATNSLYSSLFAALSAYLFVKQREQEKTYNPYLILSLTFYFISIQTHLLAIFLPLGLLVLNIKKWDKENLKFQSRLLAFFVFMVMKIVNIINFASAQFTNNETHPFTLTGLELILMRIAHTYETLIAPNVLSPLYSFSSYNDFTTLHVLIFLLVLLIHFFFLKGFLSKVNIAIFLSLLPISGIFAFRYIEIAPYSDDLFYLSFFLVWAFIIGILYKVFEKREYLLTYLLVLFSLTLITFNFNYYEKFRDTEPYYLFLIEKAPEKYHGYLLLADVRVQRKQFKEARDLLLDSEVYWLYFPKYAVQKIQNKIARLDKKIQEQEAKKEKKKGESPRP
jgi:hypothetical protein